MYSLVDWSKTTPKHSSCMDHILQFGTTSYSCIRQNRSSCSLLVFLWSEQTATASCCVATTVQSYWPFLLMPWAEANKEAYITSTHQCMQQLLQQPGLQGWVRIYLGCAEQGEPAALLHQIMTIPNRTMQRPNLGDSAIPLHHFRLQQQPGVQVPICRAHEYFRGSGVSQRQNGSTSQLLEGQGLQFAMGGHPKRGNGHGSYTA
jgi:hypothetical protein